MTDSMLAFELGLPGHGIEWPDLPRNRGSLADLAATGALRGVLHSPDPTMAPPPQWTHEGSHAMPPQWAVVWLRTCLELRKLECAGADLGDTVIWLFHKIG